MAVRIICINKSEGYHENPHEAVSYYGWENEMSKERGRTDRVTMVKFMKEGGSAYVTDRFEKKVYCQVKKSSRGTEFLQTTSDGRLTNNLLELLECR